jgi:hypothetical protein
VSLDGFLSRAMRREESDAVRAASALLFCISSVGRGGGWGWLSIV